ncbi:MAG: HAMP domain-containing protein [Actinobacteria bacterium]|nr:MAG: HAMP domain-containing protein [Actinomycetota bacterium]
MTSRYRTSSVSLATRMVAASAVVALLVVAVFVGLILALSAVRNATKDEARSKDVTVATLELENLVVDVDTGLRDYSITGKPRFLASYKAARSALPERLSRLEELVAHEPGQLRRAQDLTAEIRRYLTDYADPVLRFAQTESLAAGRAATATEGKRRIDEIRARFSAFRGAEDILARARTRSAADKSEQATALGIAGLVLSALFIVVFGLYLARSIARPVREAAAGATQLAGGNFLIRLQENAPGEVGELTRAFNETAERLERARTELQHQNARLREGERLKSELVNTVSHELRTPLAGVRGFTALLLRRDFEPEVRRHYLGIVDAQARRLSELIDHFLDVRRIEEGRFELAEEVIDIAELLEDEAQLYGAQSAKHRLELDLPDAPLRVRGDPDRLRQVIGNLLSNAIKYSPQGGVVSLAAERDEESVRVQVRDEGVGIPTTQQARIFTKFFRGDMAASGITGTGLGLAVSRDIVESHGGRIGFTSAEGQGTSFWLELPGADSDGDGGPQPGNRSTEWKGEQR